MSRFLTADRIHDGERFLLSGTVLELDGQGTVLQLHAPGTVSGAERLGGIICPGFVNAHCHLELSHMLGAIPAGTGLIPFLLAVIRGRGGVTEDEKLQARSAAYQGMIDAGIIAVGDIANTADTVDLRSRNGLHMHTFVECMGFVEATAQSRLDASVQVLRAFQDQPRGSVKLAESIVPHAPYSVSGALFRLIDAAAPGSLISIHNQETPGEDQYYRDKSGSVRDLLGGLGIDDALFEAPGCSSLQAYLPYFDPGHPMLLVHNTCTTGADMVVAKQRPIEPYWCLCPGANLYIEGRVPDLELLAAHTDRICIGTDSLASNHRLSVLYELQLINARYPGIGTERLLRWACSGGADALQLGDVCGRLAAGLKPGVVQLEAALLTEAPRRIV